MDMSKLIQRQTGFTLIEVLIALFVFSVGILGVGAMQLNSIKGNSHARRISEATNVAADQIEQFYTLNYEDISDRGDELVGRNYQVSWDVTITGATSVSPEFKTIKVFVHPNNQTKTISLETIKIKG